MNDSLFAEPFKGTSVTARDIATGESETQTILHDYCLVTSGDCYVADIAVRPDGTHFITVKGVQRG